MISEFGTLCHDCGYEGIALFHVDFDGSLYAAGAGDERCKECGSPNVEATKEAETVSPCRCGARCRC